MKKMIKGTGILFCTVTLLIGSAGAEVKINKQKSKRELKVENLPYCEPIATKSMITCPPLVKVSKDDGSFDRAFCVIEKSSSSSVDGISCKISKKTPKSFDYVSSTSGQLKTVIVPHSV